MSRVRLLAPLLALTLVLSGCGVASLFGAEIERANEDLNEWVGDQPAGGPVDMFFAFIFGAFGGMPSTVLEGGPGVYEAAEGIPAHKQRLRDSVDTDWRGDRHLTPAQ